MAKPVLESLFNKAAGLQGFKSVTLLKRDFQHRCFPVIIAKFLRTPILKNIWEGLLLFIQKICWSIRIVSKKYASREVLSL